ncbi:6-bladed beta-propeller [Algibacter pacificus]|uniref:6-bladed beta-propeller n=1 Tax=Algibacter pacificus TaxID=2599389 RepID=UPI0011CA0415|nr:6-bladed beta-propeller [Algibacter pacificus]
MKNILLRIIVLIFISFSSCKDTNELEKNIENIKVDVKKKYPRGNFKDYFSSSKVISLETNEHSIFHNIDRMSLYDNKFFILDKKSNGVYIFNNKGKFLNKIQNIGKGPGEYISLMDFTIDEKENHIILYTDRPYKLLTYTPKGQLIKEKKVDDLYFNMSFTNNKLLFMTKNIKRKNKLIEYDLKRDKKKGFLTSNEKDKFFSKLGMLNPSITKNENIHISFPYLETIYEYNEDGFFAKYNIDFGKGQMPNAIINKLDKDYKGLYNYVKENNYGFGISNFRENKDYVTFNFYNNMIVIYSKVLKKSNAFRLFINDSDQIPFYNYFAHDGDDNKIISIYPAIQFKNQMDTYKKEIKPWKRMPAYLKELDKKVSHNDNPLLIVYSFKE